MEVLYHGEIVSLFCTSVSAYNVYLHQRFCDFFMKVTAGLSNGTLKLDTVFLVRIEQQNPLLLW